jgi:sec-independent protein translocase protein TatA
MFGNLGMFGSLGMTELIIILAIILLLFGARRLPELAKGMGQSMRAFKQGMGSSQLEDNGEPINAIEAKKLEMKS